MLPVSIALTQPNLIAGAVVVSGVLLPEVQPCIAPAEQLVGLPVLLMHGTADAVVPIHYAVLCAIFSAHFRLSCATMSFLWRMKFPLNAWFSSISGFSILIREDCLTTRSARN